MQDVSAEGAPLLSSQPDGEPLPSAWEDDEPTRTRETDPDAVTSPGRRLRPPERRSSLGPRGLRPARPRRAREEQPQQQVKQAPRPLEPDESTATSTRTPGLRALGFESSNDEETGSFSVQLPSGLGEAELSELGGDRRCDVRHLTARKLEALSATGRRQLFVRLAGQQSVVGTELILADTGRHELRDATSCGLVLLANRHVSRHRSRALVAEMFAAAPDALLERIALDRRLSRAVVDHLPMVVAQSPASSEALVRQAVASWLRQRSATATQAVARVVRQAPTWDRQQPGALGVAAPAKTAEMVVAALDVLIAQQTYAAGEVAIATARLVDGPAPGASHVAAVATRLCERAAADFQPG